MLKTNPTGAGKGVRTAAEYLAGLQDDREVWTGGERVKDVTTHPATRRGAATLAGFLERQSDPALVDTLTYEDEDGDRCAMAFMLPKSKEDVKRRGKAYYEWATWSHGMFGRTPDYKNASLMAFAGAAQWLDLGVERGMGNPDFTQNMRNYYDYARKNDLVLTHTLLNPHKSHAVAGQGRFDDEVALHVVRETDAGIIVRGARLLATLGPTADEIEVFPSTVLKGSEENPLPSPLPFRLRPRG